MSHQWHGTWGLLTKETHSWFVLSITDNKKILENVLISENKYSNLLMAGLRKTIKIPMVTKILLNPTHNKLPPKMY